MTPKQQAALDAFEEVVIDWYDSIVSSNTIRFPGNPHYGTIDPEETDLIAELRVIEEFAKAFGIVLPTREQCSGIKPPGSEKDHVPDR